MPSDGLYVWVLEQIARMFPQAAAWLLRKLRQPDLQITDPRTVPGDCAVDFKCRVTLVNNSGRRLQDVRISARIATERALNPPKRLSVWRGDNPFGIPMQDGRDAHVPILEGDPQELTIDGRQIAYDPFSIRVTEGEPDAVEYASRHLEITVKAHRPSRWGRKIIGDFTYIHRFKWDETQPGEWRLARL